MRFKTVIKNILKKNKKGELKLKTESPKQTLTSIKKLAQRWNCSERLIWEKCRDGEIPSSKIGDKWFISMEYVEHAEKGNNQNHANREVEPLNVEHENTEDKEINFEETILLRKVKEHLHQTVQHMRALEELVNQFVADKEKPKSQNKVTTIKYEELPASGGVFTKEDMLLAAGDGSSVPVEKSNNKTANQMRDRTQPIELKVKNLLLTNPPPAFGKRTKYITIKELTKRGKVGHNTINRWCKIGKAESIYYNNRYLISTEWVKNFEKVQKEERVISY